MNSLSPKSSTGQNSEKITVQRLKENFDDSKNKSGLDKSRKPLLRTHTFAAKTIEFNQISEQELSQGVCDTPQQDNSTNKRMSDLKNEDIENLTHLNRSRHKKRLEK